VHDTAERWADALLVTNDERWAFEEALRIYGVLLRAWPHLGIAAQKRLAASPDFQNGLMLVQATDRQWFVDVRRRVLDLSESGLSPAALIGGEDLIAMGMKPGPILGRILEGVYDAQLEGSFASREDALRLAKAIAAASDGDQPPRSGKRR
jgi:poly(A) polymerase